MIPMTIAYRLRQMTAEDIPAVHALERELFPLDAWPASFFHDELAATTPPEQGGTRAYRVAVTTGEPTEQVVGYAGLMCVLPLADIQTIAVAESVRRQGIGTALMQWMLDESQQRGATDLLLEVRADNPGAQQLYQQLGFEHISTRPHYYPPGVDALVMRKILPNTPTHDDPKARS